MAATKSRTTRRPSRSRASAPRAKSSPTKKQSLASRTGSAIKERPVASAAIATGAFSAIAAAVAGFFAFKKSGKSFSEFSSDVADSVKDKASETSTRVKDGLSEAKAMAGDLIDRRKDGVTDKSQTELSEEALTFKETGKKTKGKRPVDPVIEDQSKVGAISY